MVARQRAAIRLVQLSQSLTRDRADWVQLNAGARPPALIVIEVKEAHTLDSDGGPNDR
jgi:hypothetical protein